MNYKEIYLWGKGELERAGVPEFDLDARLLLEHICHTNRNTLLVHGDREVSENEETQYQEAICKRSSRIPLQHITGVQEFMGLEFSVNEHVLCPRQDTECLVEEVMRYLHDGNPFAYHDQKGGKRLKPGSCAAGICEKLLLG